MSLSNGLITAPVSIDDVASALGHGSYDLGTLCMSNNVNKWSFRKPIIHSSNGELSEQDYYNQNDGFTIVGNSDPASVGLAMLNKTAWVYNRQAETDWHRLTDFLQYKSGEGEWFNFALESSSIEHSSLYDSITARITETNSYGSELSTSWLKHICTNFAKLKANTQNLGILMVDKSNISSPGSYYYQKIYSISNLSAAYGDIDFTITGLYENFGISSYYIIPVLAVETGVNGFVQYGQTGFPYDFCSLPINVASLAITQEEVGIGASFVYTRSSKSTPNDYHSIPIYGGDFKCTFYNKSSKDIYVDYHIYSYDGEYNKVYWRTESSVRVPAALSGVFGEASVTNNMAGGINCYDGGYYDTAQLMIYIDYSFSNSGTILEQTADIYYSEWVDGIN